MELVGVHVVRHRSVEDQWLPMEPLTVLFGRNGVGKTNLLEAIYNGMFGIAEDNYGREVREGGAQDPWVPPAFILRLPDAWTTRHPDQLCFGQFVAGLISADLPEAGLHPDTVKQWLAQFTTELVAELPAEVAAAVGVMLKEATAEPVLLYSLEGTRLAMSSVVHARHRLALASLLGRTLGPPPRWVEALTRVVERDEVVVFDVGRVDLLCPWHYPPLGCGLDERITNDLASVATSLVRGKLEGNEHSLDEWSIPVDLQSRPVSYAALDGGRDSSHPSEAARGTAKVTAGWLAALAAVERRVNDLLPSFAHDVGPIRLYPRPLEFSTYQAPRYLGEGNDIVEEPPEPGGLQDPNWPPRGVLVYAGVVPVELVSKGTGRWIALSLQMAREELLAGEVAADDFAESDGGAGWEVDTEPSWASCHRGPRTVKPGSIMPILAIDEPELHLHPAAQADVFAWLRARVRSGATVLVATHSPALLALPAREALLLRVERDEIGRTTVRRFGANVLAELHDHAGVLAQVHTTLP